MSYRVDCDLLFLTGMAPDAYHLGLGRLDGDGRLLSDSRLASSCRPCHLGDGRPCPYPCLCPFRPAVICRDHRTSLAPYHDRPADLGPFLGALRRGTDLNGGRQVVC